MLGYHTKHQSSASVAGAAAAKLGVKGQTGERSLSAAAVFAEIMSIIKGSTGALRSGKGYLSRDEYEALPAKAGAIAGSASVRRELYDMFLKYQEVTRSLNCYDICDVIFAIHSGLVLWKGAEGGERELPIDCILVDEVQDCSQALIKTFLSACRDPNGLFLAGDTCQTISKDVGGFRFEDLRTMFFAERELQLRGAGGQPVLYEGDARLVNVPPLLQLATNYRSHDGILRCANVLVSMLVELFPTSVDRMRQEGSTTAGDSPLLLPDVTHDELYRLIHGQESSAPAEFGANQVIIVRNSDTKAQVRSNFPTALVMTVMECKGLEFEDVIIFNFFSDSELDARALWLGVLKWVDNLRLKLNGCSDHKDLAVCEMRSVLGRLEDEREYDKLSSMRGNRGNALFEPNKHYLICEELKALYVSVTRAKNRVVFFDGDEARRAPLFELLEGTNTAQKMTLAERAQLSSSGGGAGSLAQASTAQEWRAQGLQLFRAQRFDGAAHCFSKSKDAIEFSEAAACRDIADAMLREASPAESAEKLAAAAERLLAVCSSHGMAVHAQVAFKCLVSAGVSMGQESRGTYLQLAQRVLHKLGRVTDAKKCERVAVSGVGDDVLVSALGIRHSQLLHYPWTCLRVATTSSAKV